MIDRRGHDEVSISLKDLIWQEDAGVDRLLATAYIYGVPHHLEAIRVVAGVGGQAPADLTFEYALDAARVICDAEPFQTCRIPGYGQRRYVIVMTPFAE